MPELNQTKKFLTVVKELRRKCPWDKKQTHQTLLKYLIEEAYEVVDAIERKDTEALKEELGDLLLQIALHAEIASEKKRFDFEEVSELIMQKMIRRHPHIYQKKENGRWSYEKHLKTWNRLKSEEKPKKKGLLNTVPKHLPGLQLAQKFGDAVAQVNFDWEKIDQVWEKVNEEMSELKKAFKKNEGRDRIEEEMGDLFFSLGQLSRHLKINAELAAVKGAHKFKKRFEVLERAIELRGEKMEDFSLEELNRLWDQQKASAKSVPKLPRHRKKNS